MEQSEHLLDAEVNNFGDNQSRRNEDSCQQTSLNETSQTKMTDASEGKQEFITDDGSLKQERQMSGTSVNSDVKNSLAINLIAETYDSDDETSTENSASPVNKESSQVKDINCQEMGGNNFVNAGDNSISVPAKGTSLEGQNNNSINVTDASSRSEMIVESEHIKESENDGRTLGEPNSDGKTENDGRTSTNLDSDGQTLVQSESDEHLFIKPKLDGCTIIETDSVGHTVMDVEHTLKKPSENRIFITNRENNDGHTMIELGSGHTLIETGSDQTNPVESEGAMDTENAGHTLMKTDSDGQMLMETDNNGYILIKSENEEHIFTEQANDQSTHILSRSDGHTLMDTNNDGHTPSQTDSEMNVLIKCESGEHTLEKTETNEHVVAGPESNEQRHIKAEDNGLTLNTQPRIEDCLSKGPEGPQDTHTCAETEHPVYTMSSIDKELEIIGEVQGVSQTAGGTEVSTGDNSSSSDSSSDDESSSSESSSSDSEGDLEDIRKEIEKEEERVHTGPLKTKSELLFKDLPEIPVLDITIDENIQLVELGVVFNIVESLVVVKALPQTPALDSESVLFLENRSCLGVVFETFGPVQNPFYSVRFNSDTDIGDKNVHKGDKVFYAPDMMEYSNFVFVAQLKKLKGSDASWEHDEEPPQEAVEYSDDEEEAKARASKKKERMARKGANADGNEPMKTDQSGTSDHQGSNRGGRKRTWQGRGRGPFANRNQSQGTPNTSPSSLPHPAFRGPVPQPGDALPSHIVHRPAFLPQRPFMSHPTQNTPPFEMRHMGPSRGMPPRGPLGMMPQPMAPLPGPHPGPMGSVPMPSFAASRPLIGVQHMQGHWPVAPPAGFIPQYPLPGTQGFQHPGFQSGDLHFVMPPPPPPPPPHR